MQVKKGFYNIFFGFLGQVIILALGILVPRFILKGYGDEANGLISAIGQIFTYLALIESGIGQASLQELYKPIVNDDKKSISSILATTQNTYRRLTWIYLIFVFIIAFGYPLFVRIEDTTTINFFGSSYFAVVFMVLIQGCSGAVTFYFVSTIRQLMLADGRNYIIVNITTFIKVLTSLLKIWLINIGINIVLLQIVYLALSILEASIYFIIIKKRYGWINWKAEKNQKVLKERRYFVVHELSNVIFNSTDILLLSIFCNLEIASIYAIFNMVFSALNALITQIHNGCFYVLGQAYGESEKKYEKVHDLYDTFYIASVFAIISVAYVLINPFIYLYTAGLTNISYTDKWLALLFCLIQLLSCSRITSSNLIKIAGRAKDTINRAIIEAVINLVVSLVLIQFMGVYGVLLGTIVALLYRTNDMIIYANKFILKRSSFYTYKIVFCNAIIFSLIAISNEFLTFNITNYGCFFLWGIIFSIISFILYFGINLITNKKVRLYIIEVLKKKKEKK